MCVCAINALQGNVPAIKLALGVAILTHRTSFLANSGVNSSLTLGDDLPLPFSSPLASPPLLTLPLPSPYVSLRSRTPLIQLGVWRSAVSSPSEVWGRAPAEIEFGAF